MLVVDFLINGIMVPMMIGVGLGRALIGRTFYRDEYRAHRRYCLTYLAVTGAATIWFVIVRPILAFRG